MLTFGLVVVIVAQTLLIVRCGFVIHKLNVELDRGWEEVKAQQTELLMTQAVVDMANRCAAEQEAEQLRLQNLLTEAQLMLEATRGRPEPEQKPTWPKPDLRLVDEN